MLFYETSAKEGVSVEQAFYETAKKALKRESFNNIIIPDSIGGAAGAIKLQGGNHNGSKRQNPTKSSCC